jgi:hypothetical protein
VIGDTAHLRDEITELLAAAPGGMSCDAVAARLRRRRTDVRSALVNDPRFRKRGSGRASRWVTNAALVVSGTDKDGNLGGRQVFPPPASDRRQSNS